MAFEMKTLLERFFEYISYETTSDENSDSYPSTPGQKVLAEKLAGDLKEMGLQDCAVDPFGYVTATIPASAGAEQATVIGFISHMDTSDAVSGANIRPSVVKYEGGDIILNGGKNLRIRETDYPFLKDLKGKSLIVTDGTTLLGADDKAGIAEIFGMAERLMAPDAPKHGKIRIAFTPDEEIGNGTKYFDVRAFGADAAYTVDGGPIGELEYENFNAASATVTVKGLSIHPGAAKGRMINAARIGADFIGMLPVMDQPVYTEGRQGFFHILSVNGDVTSCTIKIAVREHDPEKFEAQKDLLRRIAEELNRRWGEETVTVEVWDRYRNMKEALKDHMELIEHASAAFAAHGITAVSEPVRGGTDGAKLSFAGLPCPNLSTGGYNFHSCHELIPVESMTAMTDVLVTLAAGFAE